MSAPGQVIPVALFTFARPAHTARVLADLRANGVPLLYAFSDGPRDSSDAPAVAATRELLRAVDWCDVRLVERPGNVGLGRSVMSGVTEVAARHAAFVVWEDDLASVPGTYAWLCAALHRYADDPRVFSVTGWTHPRVTPAGVGESPYFDGRAECWVWGAWSRSWRGMTEGTAREKMMAAQAAGRAADAYGADLPSMARDEERQNIWAVRWLYHHLQHRGLCVRPPWSMADHTGFDAAASNAAGATAWAQPGLRPAPPIPPHWPEPHEHPACHRLWRAAYPGRWIRGWRRVVRILVRR